MSAKTKPATRFPKRKPKRKKKPGVRSICQRCRTPWDPDLFTEDAETCDKCIREVLELIAGMKDKKIEYYMSMLGPDSKGDYDRRALRDPFNRRTGKHGPRD